MLKPGSVLRTDKSKFIQNFTEHRKGRKILQYDAAILAFKKSRSGWTKIRGKMSNTYAKYTLMTADEKNSKQDVIKQNIT